MGTARTYPRGPIFREGDEGDVMYVIRSGEVKVTKNMYGIMVKIADLGPGDQFGEMALLEGGPRAATAIAKTRVEADVYDRTAVTRRIAAEPEFALSLLRSMSHRLRQVDESLTELVAKGRLPREEAAKLGRNSWY
jgi:CRP/FNR family cyclic AMP-dependent transcriptional regulator